MMQTVKGVTRTNRVVDFTPKRAQQVKPEIVDCTRDEETGEELTLICTNGKHWGPMKYAKLYNNVPLKLKPKNFKGNTPDGRVVK